MLIIVLVLTGVIAVAGFITFAMLCLGIRREDKAAGLGGHAPGFAAIQARRFTGLRTQPAEHIPAHACRPHAESRR